MSLRKNRELILLILHYMSTDGDSYGKEVKKKRFGPSKKIQRRSEKIFQDPFYFQSIFTLRIKEKRVLKIIYVL